MTNGKLKAISMMSIVILTMIHVTLINLPKDVIKYAKTDAWISIIILAIAAMACAYAFYSMSIKYPRMNFAEINTKVLGNFFGRLCIIIITIYYIVFISISIRLFQESIEAYLLDRTPKIVVIGVFIYVCAYCLIKGVRTTSILFDILLPGVLIIVLGILLMTYKNADFKNIMPVMHNGFKPVIRGSVEGSDTVLSCCIISYIMPYFEDAKKTKKWILIAVGIAMFIYFLLILMSLAVFGVIEVEYLNFPAVSLAKTIEMEVEIFERTESFFMAAWIPNAITSIIVFYIITTLNIKELFKVKSKKGINRIILFQIPIFLIIALIPKNIIELYKYLLISNKFAVGLILGYLPIFFLITTIKKGKG